jgi:hypothetical protein
VFARRPKCPHLPRSQKLCEAQTARHSKASFPVRPRHAPPPKPPLRCRPWGDHLEGATKILITKRPDEGALGAGCGEFPRRASAQLNESLEDLRPDAKIFEEVNVARGATCGHFMDGFGTGYSHFTVTLHVFWGILRWGVGPALSVGCSAWGVGSGPQRSPLDMPFPLSPIKRSSPKLFDALDKSAVKLSLKSTQCKRSGPPWAHTRSLLEHLAPLGELIFYLIAFVAIVIFCVWHLSPCAQNPDGQESLVHRAPHYGKKLSMGDSEHRGTNRTIVAPTMPRAGRDALFDHVGAFIVLFHRHGSIVDDRVRSLSEDF